MLNNELLRSELISRRAFVIGAGKLGLLSLLLARMFYMQLIKKDEYKTLSDKNRISLVLVPPPRGKIYDISGEVLASNQPCFRLLLDKGSGKNYKDELKLIARILELPIETQEYILAKVKKASPRMPITIVDQLNWQQISSIEELKSSFNSTFIDMSHMRFSPKGGATAHLIGYMGGINEQEKHELGVNNVSDFNIGKSGLERYYEGKLRGEFGYRQMEVNAYGKYVRELSSQASIPGADLYLNIDSQLQEKAQVHLNRRGCSAIVMDSITGDVLLLASSPTFEPNNFAKLSQKYWQELINDPYKPLINKAVQGNYPPGSVFKIITILAALASGIKPDHTVTCIAGLSALGGNYFRCHSKTGHGRINMSGAIKHSCNAYMYEMGRLIGPDPIIEMAKKFGFGVPTGIDLPGEISGFVPTRKWKKSKFKTEWTLGDTLNLCIGQGFLSATPIQLARFSTAIASDGKLFTPHIAKAPAQYSQIDVNPEHLKILKADMFDAVNTPGGTAYSSRILDPLKQIAGKTGTSQVRAKANFNDDLSRESIAWESRNHAVFIGFGPYVDPRFSIAVFVDHGGGGGRASAPIASNIMLEVLSKYN